MHFVKLRGFILLIISQLALCCVSLYAQGPDFRFKNISKEYGLSSNIVNGIVKDKLGFLWIVTSNGLCRYDVKGRVKVFQAGAANNSLHSSSIQCIHRDSKGFLWVGTRHGGLTKIDVVTDIWKTYRHNPEDENSLAHDEILCITEDTEGRIWIGTEGGLNIFYPEEERFVTFRSNENDPSALQAKAVLSLLQDKNGWMWAGTWGGGLHLFLPDKDDIAKSTFRNFMPPEKNTHNIIWEIYQDKEGRYWLGEEFALTYMQVPADASNEISKQNWDLNFHTYPTKDGFTTRQIFSILDDSRGNLWFTSIHGLNLIHQEFLPDTTVFLGITPDKPKLNIQNFRPDEGNIFSIASDAVLYLYEDNQDLLWIGTSKGLSQFNWRTRQFEFIQMAEGNTPNVSIMTPKGIIFSLGEKSYNYDVNTGTVTRLILPPNRLNKKGFTGLRNNEDGTICMLSDYGISVYHMTSNTFLHELVFENHPEYFEDAFLTDYVFYKNKIWVAGNGGLTVFDTQLNQIKNYHNHPEDKHSLIGTAISDLQFDNEGNLWISTWDGISLIDKAQLDQPRLPHKFKFKNYDVLSAGEGFISNKIVMLKNTPKRMYMGTGEGMMSYEYKSEKFIDRTNKEYKLWIHSINDWAENEVWMITEGGIVNYNVETETYKVYDSEYGINNLVLPYSKSYKDDEGRLYFAGQNIIVRLRPDKLLENDVPPIVFITDARILNTREEKNHPIINAKEIELQHGDYLLALSFAALNYESPEKNRYMYRLEGFDEKWTETQSTEPVVYTNLDAGNYTFKVKAANNDGVWNTEGTSLKIIKKPAFWETSIFRVAIMLLTILGIFLGVRAYNRRLVERYKEIAAYNKKLNTEIRERKKVEKSLQEKNDELVSINQDLEQFAYICSHDLKEPIRGIYSFTNLIERKHKDEIIKKETGTYFDFVYNYLETLQNIIIALGTFTEVNRKQTYRSVPVLIDDIFKKVELNLKALTEERNAVLCFNNSTHNNTICTSEYELILVLQNLVQNGIKYNQSEMPEVSVNLTENKEGHLFTVTDNGVGIEKEHHEYIFKPFKTLQNKSRTNSSGLGLAICAKIIARLKGRIWIDSELNKGSTFYVLLERQISEGENQEIEEEVN